MLIVSKQRIKIIVSCILIALFTFSFQIASQNNQTNEAEKVIETTSTPVSGKTVVLDAGHGEPDEGAFLLHKENKQLTFYK